MSVLPLPNSFCLPGCHRGYVSNSIYASVSLCYLCNSKMAHFCFVDVEGTKDVKRLINLLAITVNLYHEIDADLSGSGSKTDRVRK